MSVLVCVESGQVCVISAVFSQCAVKRSDILCCIINAEGRMTCVCVLSCSSVFWCNSDLFFMTVIFKAVTHFSDSTGVNDGQLSGIIPP